MKYYKEIDKVWQPWIVQLGNKKMVWKRKLSKGCIILLNVKLDHKHLAKAHREYILKKYNEINSS